MRPGARFAPGFTLVELIVVLALAGPFLLVVGSAASAAIGSFSATERSAKTAEREIKAIAEVERVLRNGRRRSLQTVAVRADVQLGRADAVGDWFPMPIGEPRTELEVSSLMGDPGPALQIPSRQLRLQFVRDPADRLDGRDNDRDGLIDEGELVLFRDDLPSRLLADVEQCTFERSANGIEITLRCAWIVQRGTWRRSTLQHTVFLHNP